LVDEREKFAKSLALMIAEDADDYVAEIETRGNKEEVWWLSCIGRYIVDFFGRCILSRGILRMNHVDS
jgi:hypothetical protein